MESPDEKSRDQATAVLQPLLRHEEKVNKRPDVDDTVGHDTVPKIRGWPQKAMPLQDHLYGWLAYYEIATDILLLLLPVYFIRKFSVFWTLR